MSDREEFKPTRDEQRVRDTIRSLPRVEADPKFRQRLKEEFVAGKLQDSGVEAPVSIARWRSGRSWRLLVPVVAAAVVITAMFLNREPDLMLSDIAGDGTVIIDAREFSAADPAAIARAIRPGARIQLSDGVVLDLVYARTMALQFSSAAATVPKAPARWIGKTGYCRLENGEVQVLTGPGFQGGQLAVRTSEGMIRVTGTLVSVVSDTTGTCVCVHQGVASVGINKDDMEPIPAGMRKVMFADGRPPIITDVAPPHRQHLIEFETKYRSGIRPVK